MSNDNKTLNEKLKDKGVGTLTAAQAGAAVYVMQGGETDGNVWAARLIAAMMVLDDCMRNTPDDKRKIGSAMLAACASLSMVSLCTEISLQAVFETVTEQPIEVFGAAVSDMAAHPFMQMWMDENGG